MRMQMYKNNGKEQNNHSQTAEYQHYYVFLHIIIDNFT